MKQIYKQKRSRDLDKKEPIRTAKLKSGVLVNYDVCSQDSDAYNPLIFEHIGEGVIWTIDGVNQNATTQMYFFSKIKK